MIPKVIFYATGFTLSITKIIVNIFFLLFLVSKFHQGIISDCIEDDLDILNSTSEDYVKQKDEPLYIFV